MSIILYEGTRICSLTFELLESKAEFPYGSKENHKYTKQGKSPLASKITQD